MKDGHGPTIGLPKDSAGPRSADPRSAGAGGGSDPDPAPLAEWEAAVEAWLAGIENSLRGDLMPGDLARFRQECDRLVEARAMLGRSRGAPGVLRRPGPIFLANGARRLNLDILPALKACILAHFPLPGAAGQDRDRTGRVNLPAAIQLLDLLEAAVSRLFQGRADGAIRQQLCKALAGEGRRYHRWQMDCIILLEQGVEETGPHQDGQGRVSIRNANFDQMRMELLYWSLEALQDRRSAIELRQLSKITARAAVRRVDRYLLDYLDSHEPETRIRLRHVLEAVDEVMALLRAVLQPPEEEAEAAPRLYFVQDLGAEVAERFIHHMGMLVIALFEDLEFAAGRDALSLAALRTTLLRVEEVLQFCRLVDHPLGREAHGRAIRVIRNRSDALTMVLEGRMRLAGPIAGMQHRDMLRELEQFVARRRDEGRTGLPERQPGNDDRRSDG